MLANVRHEEHGTAGVRKAVKRNESAMMCRTSRTNGHSYVRREIFIGEKEREIERERKRERHRKGKRDDQTRIM